eukprot:TRINITY_DN4189_c0_g1_i1.p1 TRINITY_DN4189_c0_g1~~TRINITY_DN4189_c0_g1_i1.p1  ORF type:complete len:112 (-),score=54.41 TRINITY_DN4189_c0_g1_i1:74-409(-)
MKASFVLFVFIAFLATIAVASSQLAGGYSKIDITNAEVISAANFAVQKLGLHHSVTDSSLISIKSAEVQVVAGLNYRLVVSIQLAGHSKDFSVVVHRKFDGTMELVSFQPI